MTLPLIAAVSAALVATLAATVLALRMLRLRVAASAARAAAADATEKKLNVLEVVGDGIYIVDGDLRVTHVNEEAERLLRMTADEIIGRRLDRIVDPLASELVPDVLAARSAGTVERSVQFRANDTWLEVRIHAAATETLVSLRDVTEKTRAARRAESVLFDAAHRDRLTGLPNRLSLEQSLADTIAEAEQAGRGFAVLFADLDRFKTINDTLGHSAGDEVLREVARRLDEAVRSGDVVARPGGDEFIILLPRAGDAAQIEIISQRLLRLLARPVVAGGRELYVTASIGAALFPAHGADAEALIAHADAAMYRTKEMGGNRYAMFDGSMKTLAVDRLSLEHDLRHAVERDELRLRYQPIVALENGEIVGCEALVRWHHPERGLIAPDAFIGIAEETGTIVGIDRWVLRQACAAAARFRKLMPAFRIAINVSSRDLREPDLPDVVALSLAEHGLSPDALAVEVTESIALDDSVLPVLRRLHALGVDVALDDFGIGYSSLSYLKRLPVSALKIDRCFVRNVVDDPYDQAIVASIVAIARGLGFRVIAEGLENDLQVHRIAQLGCDEAQGYLFGMPLNLEVLERQLRSARATKVVPGAQSTSCSECDILTRHPA